jgi:septation ring formation regulator EzrA
MNSDEDPPALAPSSVPPMPIEQFREAETERPPPLNTVDAKLDAILASLAHIADAQIELSIKTRDLRDGLASLNRRVAALERDIEQIGVTMSASLDEVRKNLIVIKSDVDVIRDDLDVIRRTTSGDHVALVALHGRVQEIHDAVVADHELVTVAGESISALQRIEEERQANTGSDNRR